MSSAIGTLGKASDAIDEQIVRKYASYTKLQMLRSLWAYLFDSSVLGFDDWWTVDEKADRVLLKESEYENSISNSERMFVDLWRAHFTGRSRFWKNLNVRSLDAERQAQLIYFLSALDGISLD